MNLICTDCMTYKYVRQATNNNSRRHKCACGSSYRELQYLRDEQVMAGESVQCMPIHKCGGNLFVINNMVPVMVSMQKVEITVLSPTK